MSALIVGPLIELIGKGIDKIFPDKEAANRAKIDLLNLQQAGELKDLEARYAAITAEANSADPYTSRARPSFLYVFYLLLIALVIIGPLVGVFFPDHMEQFFVNVQRGFAAIPEPMWWTFTTGFLGYGGYRTLEKLKGSAK